MKIIISIICMFLCSAVIWAQDASSINKTDELLAHRTEISSKGSDVGDYRNTSYQSQQLSISGRVTDAVSGEPIAGVNIIIKHTIKGTITNANGKFTIESGNIGDTLVFSFMGYNTEEVVVGSKTQINISMIPSMKSLDEVVVIGYGTAKRSDLTGAIVSIKSDDLNQINPTSLEQGLQGKAAGVLVTQNDGAPGGGISVVIRGSNSFSNSQPLYVIDGIPISFNNRDVSPETGDGDIQQNNALSFLDPKDIESIEILKDASATAIYGSRGANGVVLVTTKKGKEGYSKIEVSSEFGLSNVSKIMDVMSARDYATYKNESHFWTEYWKAGAPGDPEDFELSSSLPYPGTLSSTGTYKKNPEDYSDKEAVWQNALFRTGVSKKYGVGAYGGNDRLLYSFRFNHTDQDGIIINSGFQRNGINFNITSKSSDWFTVGTSGNLAMIKYKMFKTADESLSKSIGLIKTAVLLPPTYAEDNMEDLDEGRFWAASSPIAYANTPEESNLWNIFSSSFTEIKFLPNLKLKTVLGYSSSLTKVNKYSPRTVREGIDYDGIARAADKWWESYNIDNILTFEKSYGNHNITAMVTGSYEENNWYYKKLEARGFGTDITSGWDLESATEIVNPVSDKGDQKLFSLLGRINYDYNKRYYLTASVRRDGSSKFSKNNKWGTFPSFAVSWNIANESFMSNITFVNKLKLRYSYGQIGNQGISSYSTLTQYIAANYQFGSELENGYVINRYNPGNANLKWETTTQNNIGLDVGLLDDRIVLTAEYYHKKTDDLLRSILNVPSSGTYQQVVNIGKVENKGFELSLSGVIVSSGNYKWDLGGNISFNRNKILKFGDTEDAKEVYGPSKLDGLILTEGYPIGQLYGWIEDGYWNSIDEYKNSTIYQKLEESERPADEAIVQNYLGEIKFLDINNDSTIDDNDRTFIGDVNPDFIFGISSSFSYKNFNLSVFFQGVVGNEIINGLSYNFNQVGYWSNVPKESWENAWSYDNTENAEYPKLFNNDNRLTRFTSRYVEDGSYIKLKNVSLSYNFKNLFEIIDNLNVYVSATNLFTITDYSGFDPEVNSYGTDSGLSGVDLGAYPSSRTYTFGIKATF